jgi:phosphomannomutase / phosphoglucomutase
MKPIIEDVFRAYDIRGVIDVDFDGDWVETLGRACGAYFLSQGHASAVVGHDCRHSSPEYQTRLVRGLAATGMDVVVLNMVPTPVFYYAVKSLERRAGVMITASHNPPEYNGFKIWAGETTIHTDEIRNIYKIMAQGVFPEGQGVVCEHDIVPSYLDYAASRVSLDHPVKVVLDGGNGAGGLICEDLLRRIGAEVVPLYCEPDGSFPNHHPDPVVEKNVGDLMAEVVRTGAQAGIGLDGDADRIGVVDEQGEMVYGDKTLAIYAREVLKEHPGASVLGEVKCSHLLFRDVEAHGGKAEMGMTGHSMIKARMLETGALLAGEMSGHMFFADRYFGFDDALYAAARLVEILGRHPGKPLSSYLDDWPRTVNTPEIRMDCPEAIKFQVVKKAQDYFRGKYDLIDTDGARLTFPDGWGLVRASNTQPVLVLRFEAESQQRLDEIRAVIEEPLRKWIEEMG